jgi:RNA polymerase sigma-70 factor (ECF subfamily)
MTEFNTFSAAFPVSPAAADEMLGRCLAGEESAYLAVYNEYAATIYRLCYSLLQHQEDAEEVLQDSFEYAFRKLHKYDARKAAFKTWLYQIAVSRCRNKRRRKWLPTFSINDQIRDEVVDKATPTPAEMMAMTERQQVVWEALQDLTPKLRETAVLRYYEGLTYNEIGQILDSPPKTAESRMRLAHKALRKKLVDWLSG